MILRMNIITILVHHCSSVHASLQILYQAPPETLIIRAINVSAWGFVTILSRLNCKSIFRLHIAPNAPTSTSLRSVENRWCLPPLALLRIAFSLPNYTLATKQGMKLPQTCPLFFFGNSRLNPMTL